MAIPKAIKDEEDETPQRNTKNCCIRFMKFMFSYIGLTLMVVLYSVAGGFIFRYLEQANEKMECEKKYEKYEPLKNETISKMWAISKGYRFAPDVDQYLARAEIQKVLESLRDSVLELDYDGSNCSLYGESGGPEYAWSFPGSLLFSVTVITTIGYGNIAPKTYWGQLVCIAYAVMGIPLVLVFLANIGEVLASIFRFIYVKVCCCGFCRRKIKKDKEEVKSLSDKDSGRQPSPEAWKQQYNAETNKSVESNGPLVVDADDDEQEDDYEDADIPLTVSLLVVAGYILFGALLFGVWEGWDALEAAYFCFVTISTIGFGDVVPGSDGLHNGEGRMQMIIAAVYTVFGLALLSMCFSLIQEEIAAKFNYVKQKAGMGEEEKEEHENDDGSTDTSSERTGKTPPPGYRGKDNLAKEQSEKKPAVYHSPSTKKKM